LSKILLIEQPEGCLGTDETFSFVSEDGVSGANWNVSLMRRAIMKGELKAELVHSPYTESFLAALKNIDLNPAQMKALTPAQIDEPAMHVILQSNGLGVCIDGNHRMMERYNRGHRTYQTVLIREPDDHPYRLGFFEYDPATGRKTPVNQKFLTETGWGTFPQHSSDYQKRRT
jgi:hypothetical protein